MLFVQFPKKRRIENNELIAFVKTLPCIACRKTPAGDAHHVTTRKAGGDDVANNLMPLCREHHTAWHKSGPGLFIERFPSVRKWLEAAEREDVLARVRDRVDN